MRGSEEGQREFLGLARRNRDGIAADFVTGASAVLLRQPHPSAIKDAIQFLPSAGSSRPYWQSLDQSMDCRQITLA
jgi:hypothetical protein